MDIKSGVVITKWDQNLRDNEIKITSKLVKLNLFPVSELFSTQKNWEHDMRTRWPIAWTGRSR